MESRLFTTLSPQSLVYDKPESDLSCLRHRLRELNVWPEAGDLLLELLPSARWNPASITESDTQWLPEVVEGVLKGLDIGARYPSFFQKLLTSNDLRVTFLQELDKKIN